MNWVNQWVERLTDFLTWRFPKYPKRELIRRLLFDRRLRGRHRIEEFPQIPWPAPEAAEFMRGDTK